MITIDLASLNLPPGCKVLDLGCGEGRHIIQACRKQGLLCAGTDLSFPNLEKTAEKLRLHHAFDEIKTARWMLSQSDITKLGFKSGTFDTVICSEVLEHIPDHFKAISEMLRVLKPGGTLAVSVPRFLPEKICWLLSKAYTNEKGGHIRIYRKNELIGMIRKSGAVHRKTHYAHSLHAPFWWLKCLIGPEREDSKMLRGYHRLLVWDMMDKPALTSALDKLLNPLIGKSLVLYFIKPVHTGETQR